MYSSVVLGPSLAGVRSSAAPRLPRTVCARAVTRETPSDKPVTPATPPSSSADVITSDMLVTPKEERSGEGVAGWFPVAGAVALMTPIMKKIFEIVPLNKPLVPALKSNWLLMHVSVMIFSYFALMVGSIGVLVDFGNDKISSTGYKTIGTGYVLLTLGIISGAVWANEAWGNYWSWDPKETWALVTWLVYATYLHTQNRWFAGAGLLSIFMCFWGFQFLATSLHNY